MLFQADKLPNQPTAENIYNQIAGILDDPQGMQGLTVKYTKNKQQQKFNKPSI